MIDPIENRYRSFLSQFYNDNRFRVTVLPSEEDDAHLIHRIYSTEVEEFYFQTSLIYQNGLDSPSMVVTLGGKLVAVVELMDSEADVFIESYLTDEQNSALTRLVDIRDISSGRCWEAEFIDGYIPANKFTPDLIDLFASMEF